MVQPAARKGLLIGYSGRIATISSLMPDNGLASLAGVARAKGVQTKIMDLSTTINLRLMTPHDCTEKLRDILAAVKAASSNRYNPINAIRAALAMRDLKKVEEELAAAQQMFMKRKAEEIINEARQEGYGFIGFKLWNGDGFEGSVMMAEMIKKALPDVKVFFGGPQAQFFKERVYKYAPSVDAISVGDGEKNFEDLLEFVYEGKKLSSIDGIIYRDGTGSVVATPVTWKKDVCSLPLPDYSISTYPALWRDQKIKIFVVTDIYGCANGCSFCVIPNLYGGTVRAKGFNRTADEIESIVKETGSHSIRFGGAASSGSSLLGALGIVSARGIHLNAASFGRINDISNLSDEQLKELREHGLLAFFYGVEAESDEKLKLMKKKLSVGLTEETIRRTKEAGIMVAGSMIYPNTGDTAETRNKLIDLVKRTGIDSVLLQFLGVYPGTDVSRHPGQYGVEIVYPSLWKNILVKLGLAKKPSFYDDEIQDYLIKYKIKTHFPPEYWKPLPWKLNGMGFSSYAAETTGLFRSLRRTGVTMKLTDEEILMAKCAGIGLSEFYDMCFEAEFTSDWLKFEEIVKRVNAGVAKKVV